jgi:hypothetical protein
VQIPIVNSDGKLMGVEYDEAVQASD